MPKPTTAPPNSQVIKARAKPKLGMHRSDAGSYSKGVGRESSHNPANQLSPTARHTGKRGF